MNYMNREPTSISADLLSRSRVPQEFVSIILSGIVKIRVQSNGMIFAVLKDYMRYSCRLLNCKRAIVDCSPVVNLRQGEWKIRRSCWRKVNKSGSNEFTSLSLAFGSFMWFHRVSLDVRYFESQKQCNNISGDWWAPIMSESLYIYFFDHIFLRSKR